MHVLLLAGSAYRLAVHEPAAIRKSNRRTRTKGPIFLTQTNPHSVPLGSDSAMGKYLVSNAPMRRENVRPLPDGGAVNFSQVTGHAAAGSRPKRVQSRLAATCSLKGLVPLRLRRAAASVAVTGRWQVAWNHQRGRADAGEGGISCRYGAGRGTAARSGEDSWPDVNATDCPCIRLKETAGCSSAVFRWSIPEVLVPTKQAAVSVWYPCNGLRGDLRGEEANERYKALKRRHLVFSS